MPENERGDLDQVEESLSDLENQQQHQKDMVTKKGKHLKRQRPEATSSKKEILALQKRVLESKLEANASKIEANNCKKKYYEQKLRSC